MKTWKREVAIALLAYLIVLSVFDILSAEETRAFAWAELFSTPIFLFVAGAFGLDAAVKQGGVRRREKPRNDLPPDGWGA